jgi:hypothetical protein
MSSLMSTRTLPSSKANKCEAKAAASCYGCAVALHEGTRQTITTSPREVTSACARWWIARSLLFRSSDLPAGLGPHRIALITLRRCGLFARITQIQFRMISLRLQHLGPFAELPRLTPVRRLALAHTSWRLVLTVSTLVCHEMTRRKDRSSWGPFAAKVTYEPLFIRRLRPKICRIRSLASL